MAIEYSTALQFFLFLRDKNHEDFQLSSINLRFCGSVATGGTYYTLKSCKKNLSQLLNMQLISNFFCVCVCVWGGEGGGVERKPSGFSCSCTPLEMTLPGCLFLACSTTLPALWTHKRVLSLKRFLHGFNSCR